ncbi:MAG TPA: hypothetical protein VIW45_12055 [Vicinamibacterales bacterium]
MKKLLTTLACTFVAAAIAAPALAQTLADVARKEEERRKEIKQPAKVITNTDLKPGMQPTSPAPAGSETAPAAKNDKKDDKAATTDKPSADAPKDQAYWSGRKKALQTTLDRDSSYADALQVKINALTADFVNRDDPAQRSKIEQDRNKALAELDRLKKTIDADKKALIDLDDEARKAGVPPGWLR